MKKLFVTIMRSQRNYGDIDFKVVDFVDHAVLLVDTAAPRFFKLEVLQVLNLPCTCARMLLQFKKHIGNLLDGGLVATAFDDSKFNLRLFGKKNNVGHHLEGVDKRHNILFAFQSRKLRFRTVSTTNIILYGLHIAAVGKELISRRTDLVRVGVMRWLQQFTCQPTAVSFRERQTLNIGPKFVCCNSCHDDND